MNYPVLALPWLSVKLVSLGKACRVDMFQVSSSSFKFIKSSKQLLTINTACK